MQLGAGPEIVVALHNGAIAAAALTHRYALPFLERGWPVLIDLSKTDLVYPSSCVTSSRDFIKAEPAVVQNFLRYVAGINLIKKEPRLCAEILRHMDARKGSGDRQENRRNLCAAL